MKKQKSLEERLEYFPDLKKRFDCILSIAENETDYTEDANLVEERLIEEVRKLGQEVMEDWAEKQSDEKAKEYKEANPRAKRDKKKVCTGIVHLEK